MTIARMIQMEQLLQKKVDRAIKLIQSASMIASEHGQPVEVSYSGGKDSDVILELTKMAGVPYRAIYRNTTIDPPRTIKHVLDMGAEIVHPKNTFFELVKKKGLHLRYMRFCCSILKEYKILDYVILGIRREESARRNKRYTEPEVCRVYTKKKKARHYFPILDWTNEDVSSFIEERGVKCHQMYYDEQGNFHPERRLGCIGCPLQYKNKRIEQLKKYPRYIKAWINAGEEYLRTHPNSKYLQTHKDVYAWFVDTLFYENRSDAWFKANNGLLSPPDYKEFLEDYFCIKFDRYGETEEKEEQVKKGQDSPEAEGGACAEEGQREGSAARYAEKDERTDAEDCWSCV